MPTIDQLIAALQEQRRIHGGGAEVEVISDEQGLGLAVTREHRTSHLARDAGLAATVAPLPAGDSVAHSLYLVQRAMGDVRAVRRGRLAQRLVRRAAMKRIGRSLFGRL